MSRWMLGVEGCPEAHFAWPECHASRLSGNDRIGVRVPRDSIPAASIGIRCPVRKRGSDGLGVWRRYRTFRGPSEDTGASEAIGTGAPPPMDLGFQRDRLLTVRARTDSTTAVISVLLSRKAAPKKTAPPQKMQTSRWVSLSANGPPVFQGRIIPMRTRAASIATEAIDRLPRAAEAVTIPAGSTGNRTYTATWETDDLSSQIADFAIDAIRDRFDYALDDYTPGTTAGTSSPPWSAAGEESVDMPVTLGDHPSPRDLPVPTSRVDGEVGPAQARARTSRTSASTRARRFSIEISKYSLSRLPCR